MVIKEIFLNYNKIIYRTFEIFIIIKSYENYNNFFKFNNNAFLFEIRNYYIIKIYKVI